MSQKIPFPHILVQRASGLNKTFLRVVIDQDVEPGEYIVFKKQTVYNKDHEPIDAVYFVWELLEIDEKRPAKGDWSAWPKHPTYYEGNFRNIGEKNEKEVQDYLPKRSSR